MHARGKSGMTDKPIKDIMTRKFLTDSSDSSSDSDSESVSSFVALPEEFRPNMNVRKQPASEEKKDFKVSDELGRQHVSQKPAGNKSTISTSSNKVFDSSKCGVSKDELTLSFQKRAMSLKSNCLPPPFCDNRVKRRHQMDRNKIFFDGKEKTKTAGINVVKDRGLSRETVNPVTKNQLEPRTNNLNSFLNDVKQQKSLQYECKRIHEQSALQMNFDRHSFEDSNTAESWLTAKKKLVYDVKLIPATSTSDENESSANNEITNQNFPNDEKRSNFLDEGFVKQQGVVKWDSSLNLFPDEKIVKWSVVQKTELFTVRERKVTDVSQLLHNVQISEEFNSDCPRPINFPSNNTNYKKSANPKKFHKAMKRNYRTNKINSKNFPSKGNQHLNTVEKQKISYTVNEQNLYPLKEKLITEKSSCLGINTVSSKPSNSSSGCCPATKSSNSPQKDGQTDELRNNRIVQSPEREERDDFTQFQKSSAEINRPAKVLNFTQDKLVRNLEDINNQILGFGKQVSDLIIGSYTALNILISFYREWTRAHKELLDLMEQLEKSLKASSEKFSTFSEILAMAKSGASLAAVIPHPGVVLAAKIVSIVTSLMQTFVKTKKVDQENTDDLDDIARVIFKNNQANADLHMYALQCSMQFEETATLIKDFHSNADIRSYSDPKQLAMTNFIRGILEYKPNHRIFYKKLHKCFQELLQDKATTLSESFCEPFTLSSSSALDVIEYLNWRFQYDDFDSSSVSHQLNVIYNLIRNSSTTEVKVLHRSVHSCVSTLKDEMGFYENCFKDISIFDCSCEDTTTSIKKGL